MEAVLEHRSQLKVPRAKLGQYVSDRTFTLSYNPKDKMNIHSPNTPLPHD